MTHKQIFIAVISLLLTCPFTSIFGNNNKDVKEEIEQKVYFFGVARNYTDSIACLTDIVSLDGVAVGKHSKIVSNLDMYSDQLKYYFFSQGREGYICATFSSNKYKDIEKQYLKVKKRLSRNKGAKLKMLTSNEFTYRVIDSKTIYRNTLSPEESE